MSPKPSLFEGHRSAQTAAIHGGVWRNFAVRNGPGDNRGATLGVSTWW